MQRITLSVDDDLVATLDRHMKARRYASRSEALRDILREAQARERLYYILPGDVSYLIVGDVGSGAGEGDLPISDEVQTTQTDWVGGLLSSVYAAGLTDATPAQLDSPQQAG